MVIQTDGTLKPVEEKLRKRVIKPETHKNWERVYYMCRNSSKTFNQAAAIYASSYGEVPNSTFPLYPTSGADFTRKVSEVRVEKLTRSKEAYT